MQTAAHTSLYPRNTRMLQTTCGVSLPFSSQLEKSENRPDMYQVDVLIGMDVLSQCDFAITHPNNQTKVTFQIPTIDDIDFKK